MTWIYDDGGRAEAGRKGMAGDCASRAIAIAVGISYAEACALVNDAGRAERKSKRKRSKSTASSGVYGPTMRKVMRGIGWHWTPTMQIGQGCKVHVKASELPAGRLILAVSKHYVAMVDGVLRDTHDCSRDGTRCVYGYWRAQQEAK